MSCIPVEIFIISSQVTTCKPETFNVFYQFHVTCRGLFIFVYLFSIEQVSNLNEQQHILLSPIMLYVYQNHRIRGLLKKCTLDHEVRMEALYNELREKALSDAKWRQIQDLNQPVSAIVMSCIKLFLPIA